MIISICYSLKDNNRVQSKIQSSSNEAKIVSIGVEREKKISKSTGKGNKWTILCIGGGKSSSRSEFGKNQPRGSGVSKQLCPALTLSIEKPTKNDEIGKMEHRNQARGIILFPKGNN